MTTFQEKLEQAVKLLIEARAIARANGEAYRAEGNRAIAQYFETFADKHQDPCAFSLGSLAEDAKCIDIEIKADIPVGMVDKDIESIYGHWNSMQSPKT